MKEAHFDVISKNPGELAQGGAMAAATDANKFDVVVLCAQELQSSGTEDDPHFHFPPSVQMIKAPLDDAELSPSEELIALEAAGKVAHALAQGRRVLVTCFAGRNRSGIVSALALHLVYGMSGAEAVRLIRTRRRDALTNESFVRYLQKIPGL